MTELEDGQAIDALVQAFFAVFDNRGGRRPAPAEEAAAEQTVAGSGEERGGCLADRRT